MKRAIDFQVHTLGFQMQNLNDSGVCNLDLLTTFENGTFSKRNGC